MSEHGILIALIVLIICAIAVSIWAIIINSKSGIWKGSKANYLTLSFFVSIIIVGTIVVINLIIEALAAGWLT